MIIIFKKRYADSSSLTKAQLNDLPNLLVTITMTIPQNSVKTYSEDPLNSQTICIHEAFMREALKEAEKARAIGEVPIGAVVVQNGEIIARGHNRSIIDCDPTAHAEIVAIREACRIMSNYRLPNTTLYVTLEPCTMCAGSFLHTRIDTVVYGAGDSRNGALGTNLNVNDYKAFNHKLTIIPRILQEECSTLIKAFFKERRTKTEGK